MKFIKTYEENIITEWRDFYINYSELYKILTPIRIEYKQKQTTILFNNEKELQEKLISDVNYEEIHRTIINMLLSEMKKVDFFYNSNMKFLKSRLYKISDQLKFIQLNTNYKSHNEKLENAMKELYKEINLMQGFVDLNLKAKSKLMDKLNKYLNFDKNKYTIDKSINNAIDTLQISDSHEELLDLITKVENIFGVYFKYQYDDHTTKELKMYLSKHHFSGSQSFYFGFINGINIILIILILFLSYNYNIDIDEDYEFKQVFPMFRGYAMVSLYIWLLAINVFTWDNAHVNYKVCFNFGNHFSHFIKILTRVSVLTSVGVIMILCYFIERIRMQVFYDYVRYIPINLTPLICWTVFFTYILLPIFNRPGMVYTYKLLFESFMIFTDFRHVWFLDQLTSFIGPMRDIEYTLCYYSHYEYTELEKENLCSSNRLIVLIIGIFPHIFRSLQCIRLVYKNGFYPQIWNLGKYFTAILVAVFSFMEKIDPAYENLWWATAAISTVYSTYWDIKFDFGFFENGQGFPLREKLSYKNKFFYYFVLLTNLFLRFMWVLSVSPEVLASFIKPEFLMLAVYSMEVIRRGMWNFIRVELHHIQICKEFRVVNYIELPFKKTKNGNFILRNPTILEETLNDKIEKRLTKLKTTQRLDNPENEMDSEMRKNLLIKYLDEYKRNKEFNSEKTSESLDEMNIPLIKK
jgi:hypothetical protein